MDRLTTDKPRGNFQTMLNFVHSKDGLAYIAYGDESGKPIPLTEWAKKQCEDRNCTFPENATPEQIDDCICDCAYGDYDCPVFLAYTFACQACHLRDRLKMYEDVLFDKDGKEIFTLEDIKGAAEDVQNLEKKTAAAHNGGTDSEGPEGT